MSEPITYVGIDAHKVELHVALLAPDASAPVIWKVQNEARAVERLRRKLEKAAAGPVACCYEAGPCGYVLQRQLERGRVQCQVIAPALVPRKPGGADQDRPAGRAQAGGTASGGAVDRGAAADAGRGSGARPVPGS